MTAVKLKLAVAKYITQSKARKKLLDRQERTLGSKVVKAHERLAKLHHLLLDQIGQSAVDKVYANPFHQDYDLGLPTSPPLNNTLATLTNNLYESDITDNECLTIMTSIRRTAKKEATVKRNIENAEVRLEEINDRIDACYNALYESKPRLWVFLHTRFCCL